METKTLVGFPEPRVSRWLFASTGASWFWLIVRVYLGYIWIHAGWDKVTSPAWTGDKVGLALTGFINGALAKTSGAHPDVQGWYGSFLENIVLPNVQMFSYLVAYGEVLVGIALIIGAFTGIAAAFGLFMNYNFLFAGAVSTNPILLLLELLLILAWRVAGWYGLDRYLLPYLGAPWKPGKLFKK